MSGVWQWDDAQMGPLSLDAVRALHQPSQRFRISPSRYPTGTLFSGAASARRTYVLTGACSFTIGTLTWDLHARDIVDLPEGGYQFRVLGSGPVEFVSVWELPPDLNHVLATRL